jgi:hypothetical protein
VNYMCAKAVAKRNRVFLCFHYADLSRVKQVRHAWDTVGNAEPAGLTDAVDFEQLERKGLLAVENWIDRQLERTAVTAVLIGSQTALHPYVHYGIRRSYVRRNRLLGIWIDAIKDSGGGTSWRGCNPFDNVGVGGPTWLDIPYRRNCRSRSMIGFTRTARITLPHGLRSHPDPRRNSEMRSKPCKPKAPHGMPALGFGIPEAAQIVGTIKPQKDGARTYITRTELKRYVSSCNASVRAEIARKPPRTDAKASRLRAALPRGVSVAAMHLRQYRQALRPKAVPLVSPPDPEFGGIFGHET